MKLLDKSCYAKRLSPMDGNYFFGYYDLNAFNKAQTLHLAHKSSFADRLQVKGDTVEVGVIDIETGRYEKLDVTGAWNFQQGAMLQWNPTSPENEIIFNSVSNGEYVTTIMDIRNGKKRFLDRPVANVSPKGDLALSINFSRLYDFRPGYGYAEFGDPFYYKKHSGDDGVFLTDLKTGKSKLIISMQDIWDFSGEAFGGTDEKMVINHITFNTDGSRFLFLARNFPETGKKHRTAIITANTDGSDMFLLSDYGVQSHYYWLDEKRVIFYSDGKELACTRGFGNNYILFDKSYNGEIIANGFFDIDNHMSFSPDRKLMLTDTYPDENNMQTLRLYDIENDICVNMGNFYSLSRDLIDLRCDLHPRWNQSGDMVSFDSTHEGVRGIYTIDLSNETLNSLFDENRI